MRLQHMWTMRACLAILTVLFCSHTAAAASISVGTLAVDPFVPGVSNAFSISNLTGDPLAGGFALPPDFPSLTSLTFGGASLDIVSNDGSHTVVSLGDIAPGQLLDPSGDPLTALQFLSSATYVSARFTASLLTPHIVLPGGNIFTPTLLSLSADLLPVGGPFLDAGALTTIDIDGVTTPRPAPEPVSLLLLTAGAGGALLRRRARRTSAPAVV